MKLKENLKVSLTFDMTSTKLLAWFVVIMTFVTFNDIPNEARAFYVITMAGISTALYGVKTLSNYKNNKLNDK